MTRRATTPLELGFETLRDLVPAVAIFGSARIAVSDPEYELGELGGARRPRR